MPAAGEIGQDARFGRLPLDSIALSRLRHDSSKDFAPFGLQLGTQLFEIKASLSQVLENSFAVSTVSRKRSGQLAVVGEGQQRLFRHRTMVSIDTLV